MMHINYKGPQTDLKNKLFHNIRNLIEKFPENMETNKTCWLVSFMVFNATFNNISVISWRSVLFVEETGGHRENHRPAASHLQTLSHNVVLLALSGSRTHNISGDRNRLHR